MHPNDFRSHCVQVGSLHDLSQFGTDDLQNFFVFKMTWHILHVFDTLVRIYNYENNKTDLQPVSRPVERVHYGKTGAKMFKNTRFEEI